MEVQFSKKLWEAAGSRLVVASCHLNNQTANHKRGITHQILSSFVETCGLHKVDVVGFDLNQALGRLPSHLMPGTRIYQRPVISDCVGFWLSASSKLLGEQVSSIRGTYYSFFKPDLGLDWRDVDSHYMAMLHMKWGHGIRTPEAIVARKQRHNQARKARHAAAKSGTS